MGLEGGPGGVTVGFDCRVDGEVRGSAWFDDEVEVDAGATIGPNTVLGAGCTVGEGAEITDSVLLAGVAVGAGAKIHHAVISANAKIGEGAVVGPDAVIGQGAEIAAGEVLEAGARVPGGKS